MSAFPSEAYVKALKENQRWVAAERAAGREPAPTVRLTDQALERAEKYRLFVQDLIDHGLYVSMQARS